MIIPNHNQIEDEFNLLSFPPFRMSFYTIFYLVEISSSGVCMVVAHPDDFCKSCGASSNDKRRPWLLQRCEQATVHEQ